MQQGGHKQPTRDIHTELEPHQGSGRENWQQAGWDLMESCSALLIARANLWALHSPEVMKPHPVHSAMPRTVLPQAPEPRKSKAVGPERNRPRILPPSLDPLACSSAALDPSSSPCVRKRVALPCLQCEVF